MKLGLKHQRGYTLAELVYSLAFVAFWLTIIVVAVHFIAKCW
jgi:Tfp pilus assembly protein PilE